MAKNGSATKKAAQPQTSQGNQPELSIPSPVRLNTAATPSAAELLAALKGKKKPATKAKAERSTLDLTPSAKDALKDWVFRKILADQFDEALTNAQQLLDAEVYPLFQNSWWETKSVPQNPTLKTEKENGQTDLEGMLVVQERFKISVPELSEEDDLDAVNQKMVDAFKRIGINEDKARKLVQNEFVIREDKTIPLTELMEGRKQGKDLIAPTAAGKSAAEKLILTIATGAPLNLTEEEQEALIVVSSWQVTVKGGFLSRVCTYCDTKEQMVTILNLMVKPTLSHRGAKINDTLEEKNRRLIGVAADILGAMTEADDE